MEINGWIVVYEEVDLSYDEPVFDVFLEGFFNSEEEAIDYIDGETTINKDTIWRLHREGFKIPCDKASRLSAYPACCIVG